MTKNTSYMTQSGFDAVLKEYKELKNARPQFVEKLTEAAAQGDRSENAAYSFAKRKLRSNDGRLRFLKKILDFSTIATPSQNGQVEIGSDVTVKFNDTEFVFHIVGHHEANPSEKKISYRSPLGSALLNRKVGDLVKVALEDREITYKIVDISY